MDTKEIVARLEIVKIATTIGEHETIIIQTAQLKKANSSRLNEISTLLNSKNYRQALYLIKSYLSDMGNTETLNSNFETDSDTEKVLDIEDMLRMSPLAKEAIKDYKRSAYTEDDLAAFAKNIETVPSSREYEESIEEKIERDLGNKELAKEPLNEPAKEEISKTQELKEDKSKDSSTFVESIEDEVKEPKEPKTLERYEPTKEEIEESKEIAEAISNADSETPLDEISREVLGSKIRSNRAKALSKYKTIREKFAKKVTKKDFNEEKKVIENEKIEIEDNKEIEYEVKSDEAISESSISSEVKAESLKQDSIESIKEDKLDENIDNSYSKENEGSEELESSKELEKSETVESAKVEESSEVVEKVDEDSSKNAEEVEKSEATEKIDDDSNEESKISEEAEVEKSSRKSSKSNLSQKEQEAQDKKDRETIYGPVTNIEEKFRQSFVLYPPLKDSEIWTEEVIRFLKSVSKNSFTEIDVKRLLDEYYYFLDKGDIAKASQVLLLASSTESKFAKFLLARELFSGKVIKRDLKKSFELMKELANSFYPEAVCDLGQFYEYGIGVPKDKKVAIKLYEKAFELGVNRATKHIARLKESSGILSTIFKLK